MRIVHYATSITRSAGGLYYSVSGLAKAQHNAGDEVLVLGGGDRNFPHDQVQWGEVEVVPHPLHSKYGLSRQVFRDIAQFEPDILHVHGVWSAASIYARYALRKHIPVVLAPRGMLDPWILDQGAKAKKLHGFFLEKRLASKVYIHALNEVERKAILKFSPRSQSRIFVVPNGVERPIDYGARSPQERSGALFLGRLHDKKQVKELAAAWESSIALRSCELTVAGWGASEYERHLQEVGGRASNICFVGPLYGESKSRALHSARFFVLPSLSEGLPMSVLEALSHGAIPVITDQCNLPELFDCGVAVRIDSSLGDFERVMNELLNTPEQDLISLSEAGMKYVQRYEWPSIAARMKEHYQRIVND